MSTRLACTELLQRAAVGVGGNRRQTGRLCLTRLLVAAGQDVNGGIQGEKGGLD